MSHPPQSSPASPGRRFTIPFEIPAYWTPEQAIAVVELLADLGQLIWAHYGVQLIELVRAEHTGTQTESDHTLSTDEVDF